MGGFYLPLGKALTMGVCQPPRLKPVRLQIYTTQIPQWRNMIVSELSIKARLPIKLMIAVTEDTGDLGLLYKSCVSPPALSLWAGPCLALKIKLSF